MRVLCVLWYVCVCVWPKVCAGLCICLLEAHISAFFLFALLVAAAAVSCRLYHTVPQAPKLSTLWQPLYNSSQQVCVNHFYAFVDIAYACVLWYVIMLIRNHVALASAAVVFLVNKLFSLSNAAAHAPCFFQHKPWVYCVTCCVSLVNLRHPRDFTSHTSRRGTLNLVICTSTVQWLSPDLLVDTNTYVKIPIYLI